MKQKRSFSKKTTEYLLDWYDQNARILPWRSEPTPYHVWVSEIMLQQTRVETGLPYYKRFIEALPDIRSLAEADDELLLKLWEGLGYYSRVRNMKKAAGIILNQYGGTIPKELEKIESLPGIGKYTAGAIGSIAFGLKVPAVDGNVLRVGSRLLASKENISEDAVKKAYAERIVEIVPEDRPGDFNQALMDLGATICIPKNPKCGECPLAELCDGFREGIAGDIPIKNAPMKRQIEKKTVLLAVCNSRVALQKRPSKGILAGLWEYPCMEGHQTMTAVKRYLKEKGIEATVKKLPEARHIFSHKEWEMVAYLIRMEKAEETSGWILEEWADIKEGRSIPSAYRKYSDILDEFFGEGKLLK